MERRRREGEGASEGETDHSQAVLVLAVVLSSTTHCYGGGPFLLLRLASHSEPTEARVASTVVKAMLVERLAMGVR
eukprot:2176328-Rhodomonas_salina.1